MPSKLIYKVKSFHTNTKATIKYDCINFDSFEIKSWVKQDWNLLFNAIKAFFWFINNLY